MKSFFKVLLVGSLLVVLARAAATLQPAEQAVMLFENRKVGLAVPDGFKCAVNPGQGGTAQVLITDERKTASLELLFVPDAEEQLNSARARREMLVEQFADYVDSSSEKGMQFEDLQPRTGAGTYCVFTDAKLVGQTNLPPGEYLHLTAGVKAWPGVAVIFRLFSNDTTSAGYRPLLKMLRESVHERAVPLK